MLQNRVPKRVVEGLTGVHVTTNDTDATGFSSDVCTLSQSSTWFNILNKSPKSVVTKFHGRIDQSVRYTSNYVCQKERRPLCREISHPKTQKRSRLAEQTTTCLLVPPLLLELPRLTAVVPPTALGLVIVPALHTGADGDIDARRRGETEGFGDFDEIEGVDVEDGAQRVRGVGVQVGAVTVFC